MTKYLVVPVGTSSQDATALAVANGCVGFYTGIPPVWSELAALQGWTLPCVVTEDENGAIISWAPVA